jgi:histidinol-phosphate/aromatic aminotransferase/cobyric acid decarboxylase-like protein
VRLTDALAVGRVPHGSSDDPDLLDFSANTNPETPPGVEAVYRAAFDEARSYPSEPPAAFVQAAAEYVGVDPNGTAETTDGAVGAGNADGDVDGGATEDDSDLEAGAGTTSDPGPGHGSNAGLTGESGAVAVVPFPGGLAAIRRAIALSVDPGETALVPAPSFGEYAREVRLQGADPVFVPAEEILEADPEGHALAIVCNPNNPTGRAYDHGALRAFARRCRAAGTRVLVDEAFLGFTDRPSLAGEPGVVVARALTKLFGLPGLRAGFAVATGEVGRALASGRRPWNLGGPALATGTYCLRECTGPEGFVAATRERVARERERLRAALADLPGVDVRPSDAPFLLVDVGDRDVDALVAATRDRDVAIRDATTFRGLERHVRVAVRLPDENDRLAAALRGALAAVDDASGTGTGSTDGEGTDGDR